MILRVTKPCTVYWQHFLARSLASTSWTHQASDCKSMMTITGITQKEISNTKSAVILSLVGSIEYSHVYRNHWWTNEHYQLQSQVMILCMHHLPRPALQANVVIRLNAMRGKCSINFTHIRAKRPMHGRAQSAWHKLGNLNFPEKVTLGAGCQRQHESIHVSVLLIKTSWMCRLT